MTAADDFDQIIKGFNMNAPTENIDTNPYGAPAHTPKSGLTKRGKAALGIGAAVLAGGTLIGYQVHSASVAASNAKTQEIALKSQAIELEKLKEINRASEINRKTEANQAKTLQMSVDTCVKDHSDQAGKYGSPSYREAISDCQAQYSATTNGDGMQATASDSSTPNTSQGVSGNVLLVGGGALVVLLVAGAKRGTRSNAA